jgi:hypothetical protein
MERIMGKSKYYTVPEFAALAGVTKQAVYDRIKKDLGGFTTKQGGKTLISAEALCMVGSGAVARDESCKSSSRSESETVGQSNGQVKIEIDSLSQEVNQASESSSQVSSETSQETSGILQKDQEDSQGEYTLLEYLIKENARLIDELDKKDKLIEEKDKSIHAYADRIMGLTEQFAALVEREQDIASKALSTTGQAQLLHAMSGDQSEVVTMVQGNALSEETPLEKPKKSPWWKRKGK